MSSTAVLPLGSFSVRQGLETGSQLGLKTGRQVAVILTVLKGTIASKLYSLQSSSFAAQD